jgi:outer membrane lipopolysaccharide assembly protein LptE/RlpB
MLLTSVVGHKSSPIPPGAARRFLLRNVARLCALILVLLPASCGYQLVKDKGIYSGEITSLTVPVFKNKSFEAHAARYTTEAFTRELLNSGLFQVNKPNAEAYLEGTVKNVRTLPYTVSKVGLVNEKRIDVFVELSLFRQNGSLIKRWLLTDWDTFRADNPNYEELNKEDALRRVSDRLARRFAAALLMEY